MKFPKSLLHKLLIIWFVFWISVLFSNLHAISLKQAKPTNEPNTQVTSKENDSFAMVAEEKIEKEKLDCNNRSFWNDNIELYYNHKTSNLDINFGDTLPNELDITSLELEVSPINTDYRKSRGFDFYNFDSVKLPINTHNTKVPLNLSGLSHQVDFKLLARNNLNSEQESCFFKILSITNIDKLIFNQIQPAFKSNIFEPYDIKYFDINKLSEDKYIEKFMDYQKLRFQQMNLPKIHESSIALLKNDIRKVNDEYVWKKQSLYNATVIQNEVVMGLFGEVSEVDMEHISNLLKVLHIIAPNLKISYSDNIENVTLPIHLTPCTQRFSDKFNDCFNNAWGEFYPPRYFETNGNHGWIWVDSSLNDRNRLFVITHELGHSLGLGHNLCIDNSSMSYHDMAPNEIYFDYLDLMMLRTMYDPVNTFFWIDQEELVKEYDLSDEKIKQFEDNPSSACHHTPGGYDYLIEMQLNN